jgi:hypothetical protein
MSLIKYPYWKVGLGFLLCPALVGGFWLIFFTVPFEVLISEGLLGTMLAYLGGALFGELFFFIPAFCLAIVVIILRLHKNWQGYLSVSILGGLFSLIWSYYLIHFDAVFLKIVVNPVFPLIAGVLSALVVGKIVLPRK